MKKTTSLMWGGIILLIALLFIGRSWRQAKSETLQEAYSDIVPVSVLVTQSESFTRLIEESGTLAGRKESVIAAETGGRVVDVFVEVGSKISLGQPLVRLDDELYRLESDRAKIAYDKAAMDLERLEQLYKDQSISESDIEGARLAAKGAEVGWRLALKTYHDATIKAPFNGTVAARFTEVGQTVERGMPIVQLVDISNLKLTVAVSEENIGYVTNGAPVKVIVDAVDMEVQGKVTAIGSRATTGARTFPVEVSLPGSPQLRSGMFARAIIAARRVDDALLLPRVAILPDAGNTVVFLAHNGTAQKRTVDVIGTLGDRVAVEGISAGDTVITAGNQLVSHGTRIELSLSGQEVKPK